MTFREGDDVDQERRSLKCQKIIFDENQVAHHVVLVSDIQKIPAKTQDLTCSITVPMPDDWLEQAVERVKKSICYDWIPVTERFPEAYVPVLVTYLGCNDNKQYCDGVAIYDGICSWGWSDGNEADETVCVQITHWMPLPTPPKDGDT